MSDKHGMMKLNNENYEIWKILMEAILVRKQLHDVALGVTARPTGVLHSQIGAAVGLSNAPCCKVFV
jgi:hypothetical protein